ncbi:ParB/RepB/Spo0J family partition protein [Sphingomonas sp. UYP23]
MTDQLPLQPRKATTRVIQVDPASVRISPLNPRGSTPHDPDGIARLAAELKAVGQINDAHGETAGDGVVELLAGSRRCAACAVAGIPLRIRVHAELPRTEAIGIAYRDDREAVTPSFWDLACGWAALCEGTTFKTDADLANAVGIDKSTLSRGLAFRKVPDVILDAFADRRAISLSQWIDLAPLVEDPDSRAKLAERAALIAGKGYTAPRVAAELKAAAAGKTEIKAVEVRNRHDRIVATILPDHRGGFTIKVKPMTEAHPSFRLEYARLVNERFVELVKTWFDRDA